MTLSNIKTPQNCQHRAFKKPGQQKGGQINHPKEAWFLELSGLLLYTFLTSCRHQMHPFLCTHTNLALNRPTRTSLSSSDSGGCRHTAALLMHELGWISFNKEFLFSSISFPFGPCFFVPCFLRKMRKHGWHRFPSCPPPPEARLRLKLFCSLFTLNETIWLGINRVPMREKITNYTCWLHCQSDNSQFLG